MAMTSARAIRSLLTGAVLLGCFGPSHAASHADCTRYAKAAVAQKYESAHLACPQTGPRWSQDFFVHYDWCRSQSDATLKTENLARVSALKQCMGGGVGWLSLPERHCTCANVARRADDVYSMLMSHCLTPGAQVPGLPIPVTDFSIWPGAYQACMRAGATPDTSHGLVNTIGAQVAQCFASKGIVPVNPLLPMVYRSPSRLLFARPGDAILDRPAGGSLISAVLEVWGQQYTHTGMILSADPYAQIKHDTFYQEWLEDVAGAAESVESVHVENGRPGLIEETFDQATGFAVHWSDGIHEDEFADAPAMRFLTTFWGPWWHGDFEPALAKLLAPQPKDAARWRPLLSTVRAKLDSMTGFYRFYSYTNVFEGYPSEAASHKLTNGQGSMCSGAVWYAHYFAGQLMKWQIYDANLRRQAGDILWERLHEMVDKAASAKGSKWLDFLINVVTLGTKGFDPEDKIPTQIVNCFAFNACGEHDDKLWQTQSPGVGSTVSPSNLFPTSSGVPGALQDPSGPYGKVADIVTAGGDWLFVSPIAAAEVLPGEPDVCKGY